MCRKLYHVWPCALCLALVACGLGAADNHAPLTVFDNFRIIKAGVAYRSAQLDPTTLRLVIAEYDIRTIVNLRGENEDRLWYRNERQVAEETGVTLIDVPFSASRMPPRETLLQLYDALDQAQRPMLIHCQAGADRTGAAAAMWRMMEGDPRAAATAELSLVYGHFAARHPDMDRLVAVFKPERSWIENSYSPEMK